MRADHKLGLPDCIRTRSECTWSSEHTLPTTNLFATIELLFAMLDASQQADYHLPYY